MKTLQVVVSVSILVFTQVGAQEADMPEPATQSSTRFEAVEVYLDSGETPLAAYQFEFAAGTGEIRIVGIEGGEHPAYEEPPYYDPAALSKGRIIIAAFDTGDDLPTGKTRVARLHLQVIGDTEPEYVVKLDVAASTGGKRIPASVTLRKGEEEE